MTVRTVSPVALVAVLACVGGGPPVGFAQQVGTTMPKPSARRSTQWRVPRLASGEPDLHGVWNFATMTPLERPTAFANKSTFTDDEAAEFARQVLEDRDSALMTGGPEWWDGDTRVIKSRRTSLIVDPPNGRIPPLVPAAVRRAAARAEAQRGRGPADGPEDRSLEERCIMRWTAGPPIVPGPYNNNVQFIQSPGYVVIFSEMIHDARVIPLATRERGGVRRWMGDSRGHWAGDTLVVDTANFTDKIGFRGSTEHLHLVERFTRVDEDTINYEYTVEDPNTWTRPWTVALPMVRTSDLIYEYACHEGNYITMADTLKAARLPEKPAAPQDR